MGIPYLRLSLTYMLAAFIRVQLINSEFQTDIARRVEVTTPLNSLKRVIEGKFRQSIGVDPYSGDVLHEPPTHLIFYIYILSNCSNYLPYIFATLDIITAHFLYLFCRNFMFHLFVKQEKNKHMYADESQLASGEDFFWIPFYVTCIFLFNPFTMVNCIAMTTTTLSNSLISIIIYSLVSGKFLLTVVLLAIVTTQSFYQIILLSPLYLSVIKRTESIAKAAFYITCYFLVLLTLLITCYRLNPNFFEATIGYIFQIKDQQPNVGVFWYFFTEMFQHFYTLFMYSFQLNATIVYLVPLTLRYRKEPAIVLILLLSLITIFKSYPCVGDYALTLSLIPCLKHTFNNMHSMFVTFTIFFVSTMLGPVLWDLWIYYGSANSNFYFGATVFFNIANILLVTDLTKDILLHEYYLKYGRRRTINGKDAHLVYSIF